MGCGCALKRAERRHAMIQRFVSTFLTSTFFVVAIAALGTSCKSQVTFTEYDGPTNLSFTSNYTVVDIKAGPDGNLWFTEGYAFGAQTQIGRITTAGVPTYYSIPGGDSDGGITTGP